MSNTPSSQSNFKNTSAELWKFIFGIFPVIDLPFGILSVIYSDHWIFTLCMLPVFPLIATGILQWAAKKDFQPGFLLLSANGILFLVFVYFSGIHAPAWLMVINITVGSSFMFNNPRIGQSMMVLYILLIGAMYYLMGAEIQYCMIIVLSLLAFLILFSRTYDYLLLQKKKIEVKNHEIEAQKRDILSSITYAKRIQQAVLPQEEVIYRSIPLAFIVYQPKDIVSGDFFWFHEIDRDRYLIACADCTGHGVPGALMTVIGSNLLNQTVIDNKNNEPSKILMIVDSLINVTLKQQKQHENYVQDGMDMALLKVDKARKELTFCSARRPAFFIRNGEMREIKGTKSSLGGMITGCKTFEETVISYQEDDIIYLFTDGVTDQFGGDKGKKYSVKRLREMLMEVHRMKIQDQKQAIQDRLNRWRGSHEQVDDIQLIGIRF